MTDPLTRELLTEQAGVHARLDQLELEVLTMTVVTFALGLAAVALAWHLYHQET